MTNSHDDDLDEATIGWESARTVFTQTPDWIITNPNINDAAFRTWVTIAKFADNHSKRAFPSAKKLQELRGKGRRVIFEHIRQLEEAGVLRREARYRPNGGRTSSHYTLAWDRPLAPVQKTARGASAENRTPPDAENRAGPSAENRAPRTRTRKELDPLPPPVVSDSDAVHAKTPQGADAPRTPRPSKGRRSDGTNPRAVEDRAAKENQMRRWALTMSSVIDHDEFVEVVNGEVRSETITRRDGDIAIDESERLAAAKPMSEPS